MTMRLIFGLLCLEINHVSLLITQKYTPGVWYVNLPFMIVLIDCDLACIFTCCCLSRIRVITPRPGRGTLYHSSDIFSNAFSMTASGSRSIPYLIASFSITSNRSLLWFSKSARAARSRGPQLPRRGGEAAAARTRARTMPSARLVRGLGVGLRLGLAKVS